jgi:hypothetical protein
MTTENKGRFRKGHAFHPRRTDRQPPPSIKQTRKSLYAALTAQNMRMSALIATGQHVGPVVFQRSLHLQLLLEKKGYAR